MATTFGADDVSSNSTVNEIHNSATAFNVNYSRDVDVWSDANATSVMNAARGDNAGGEIDADVGKILTIAVHVLVTVAGIVLNSLVIAAYSRRMRKSTHVFIVALAICDLINCATSVIHVIKLLDVLPTFTVDIVCLVQQHFSHFGTLVSAGIVACIALDRYLQVKHPHTRLSRTYSILLIGGVIMTSVVVTLPYIIVYSANMVNLNESCIQFGNASIGQLGDKTRNATRSHGYVTNKVQGDGSRLFTETFYSVILACIGLIFIVVVFLYIQLTRVLMRTTVSRVPRVNNRYSLDSSDVSLCSVDDVTTTVGASPSLTRRQLPESRSSIFRSHRVGFVKDLSRILHEQSISLRLASGQTPLTSAKCGGRHGNNDVTVSRRKSNTFSIASFSKHTTPFSKTISMMLLAVVLYMFYIPNITVHLLFAVRRTFLTEHAVVSELLLNANVVCYMLNPVLYACFNRGFVSRLKACCLRRNVTFRH